uniref:Uncharacterized protein n=1 Tax=Schistosoma curassoni TaxID=6186 RepID=A0A183JP15_9TREM
MNRNIFKSNKLRLNKQYKVSNYCNRFLKNKTEIRIYLHSTGCVRPSMSKTIQSPKYSLNIVMSMVADIRTSRRFLFALIISRSNMSMKSVLTSLSCISSTITHSSKTSFHFACHCPNSAKQDRPVRTRINGLKTNTISNRRSHSFASLISDAFGKAYSRYTSWLCYQNRTFGTYSRF